MAVDDSLAKLRTELEKLSEVSEEYRTKKAAKYIELANPTDKDKKKPSEAMITALLDTDEELAKLRKDRSQHEINSKLLELEIKYGYQK